MKKKKKNIYENYFGRNIARIIYVISWSLLVYGAFNIVVGNSYWGAIYCTIGILPFFLTYHKQVSDKSIDELVNKSVEDYLKNNIKGKMIGKRELNPADFSVFSGFIRENSDVRFKSCRDGKLRTSQYYVTAISVNRTECIISTTIYNMLSEDSPVEKFFHVNVSDIIGFNEKESEFPKGNFECNLLASKDGENQQYVFYLPAGDYLVGRIIEQIKSL
ncbi:MAG: hypothetical protein IJY88_02330 [Clostridia bacterium]|nr:hypothetical protein [Clostridia bacterium]